MGEAIAIRELQDVTATRERHLEEWMQVLRDKKSNVETAQEMASATSKGGGNVIALRVRLPSGKAETLRLLPETALSVVFDFVEVTMAKDEETEFELVRTHPRQSFRRGEDEMKTLGALELSRATLLVKDLEQ